MVKIKDGYVMNGREEAEYERRNALPRKTKGTVAYYFKPQTKYPPRIYVFMHAELWCDRNRRPMGLYGSFPFLTRPMNCEEIEYHHFDTRLCYHQYEDWGKLLYAEQQEAEQLDKEQQGQGTIFYNQLCSFQQQFRLGISDFVVPETPVPEESEEMRDLKALLKIAGDLSVAEVGRMLEEEQKGRKRTTLLILLREMYKDAAGEPNRIAVLTPDSIQRKAHHLQERSRKNFVRRVFLANPLFALEEIRLRFPDYDEAALAADLKRKSSKPKPAKSKPVLDLRRVQLQKLAAKLKYVDENSGDYHTLCMRMAILEQAHRHRCPIPVSVKLGGSTEVYYFHWKTRETVVKSFVDFANLKGQTHATLKGRHGEISSSNYSF